MKNNYITEISFDDFIKLNLTGYRREWQDYGEFKQLVWKQYDLNKVVAENFKYMEEHNEKGGIVVAIHKNWNKAGQNSFDSDFYYYDKWLNKSGASTYQVGCGINKLYKGTDKWHIKDGYFDIPYSETEKIYLIHKKS
jgi:hypothetical protein